MLLNEVHRLIENKNMKFLLTGSSTRKLKHHDINLLAGRAWQAELFPLTSKKIIKFDLGRFLRYGGLPAVYLSKTYTPILQLNRKTLLTRAHLFFCPCYLLSTKTKIHSQCPT